MTRILTQGQIDGACYLYSVGNSLRTICPKRFRGYWNEDLQECWNGALQAIPYPLDFLLFDVGTARYDLQTPRGELDPTLYLVALRTILKEMTGGSVRATFIDFGRRRPVPRDLLPHIGPRSVVLTCVTRTDNQRDLAHWLVATGKSRAGLELACSWIRLNGHARRGYVYEERAGYRDRYFNDWIERHLDRPGVIQRPVFKIWRA